MSEINNRRGLKIRAKYEQVVKIIIYVLLHR